MTILETSASYIVAPVAMRLSLPGANPALNLTPSLAITFPFNITISIQAYYALAKYFLN